MMLRIFSGDVKMIIRRVVGWLCLRQALQQWCIKEMVCLSFFTVDYNFFFPSCDATVQINIINNFEPVVLYSTTLPRLFFKGNYFRSNTIQNFLPCHWIHCYCLRIMKFQVNQGDTHRPVVITHKDPVTDMVHKIEIPGEPVNCHLLHIWNTHTHNHWIACANLVS